MTTDLIETEGKGSRSLTGKSINRTLYAFHQQQCQNTELKGQPVKTSRTVVVRIATPTDSENQQFTFPARLRDIELVKDLLTDFELARKLVMEDIWADYQENEAFYIQTAQEVEYAEEHGTEVSRFLSEDGELVQTPFICQECQKPLYVHYYERAEEGKKSKPFYLARCLETEHKKGIKLSTKKAEDEQITFDVKKFKAQPLSNHFSAKYITGSKTQNGYEQCLKPFEVHEMKHAWESSVGTALRQIAARDLAGFLDKYYDIRKAIQKICQENTKRLASNHAKLVKCNITPLAIVLPEIVVSRTELESYNRLVSSYNAWLNEVCWQHHELGEELKATLPKLERLKGYPSFPLVEKQQAKNRATEEELLIKFESLSNKLEKKWVDQSKNLPDEYFIDFLKKHAPWVIWQKLPEQRDILSAPLRKYLKRQEENKVSHKPMVRVGAWLYHFHRQLGKPLHEALQCTRQKIDKKINGLKTHYEARKTGDKENRDIVAYQQLMKWYQAKISFFLTAFRPNYYQDASFYWDTRGESLDLYGLLRGNPFKKKLSQKTYEITGFDKKLQSNMVLALYINADGKREYYLLLQPLKKDKKKKLLLDSSQRIDPGNPQPGWYGFWKNREGTALSPLTVDFDEEAIIRLPLLFGTRQGRRYLWNWNFPLAQQADLGRLGLSNARIIEKKVALDLKNKHLLKKYKKQEGLYVAITIEKTANHGVLDDKTWRYETIIGVDRGEKIPLVASLIDLNGNPIKQNIQIGVDHYAIQKKYALKVARHQQTGAAQVNVDSKRAKHVADQMIHNAVAQLLDLAQRHNALIVLEDLSRGFGRRGKKTYMTLQQYTKLEDHLIQKAQEVGLYSKGDLLSNFRKGILAKVIARHTSQTCSRCGRVNSKNELTRDLFSTLHKTNNSYGVKRPDGIILTLSAELTKDLDALLKNGKSFNQLSKTDKKVLSELLMKELQYRPSQDKFCCLYCGYETHADAQAALNIGRTWLFVREDEVQAIQQKQKTPNKPLGSKEYQEYKNKKPQAMKLKKSLKKAADLEQLPENQPESMQDSINPRQETTYGEFFSRFYQNRIKTGQFQTSPAS